VQCAAQLVLVGLEEVVAALVVLEEEFAAHDGKIDEEIAAIVVLDEEFATLVVLDEVVATLIVHVSDNLCPPGPTWTTLDHFGPTWMNFRIRHYVLCVLLLIWLWLSLIFSL
jgi:hypothetical protein